jgi:hypothetical protein
MICRPTHIAELGACAGAARYAVLDTWWFPLGQVAPEASAAVRARYDCATPLATDAAFHLVICPRR